MRDLHGIIPEPPLSAKKLPQKVEWQKKWTKEVYRPRNKELHTDTWYEQQANDPNNVLKCTECSETKHVTQFYKTRSAASGYRTPCISCTKVITSTPEQRAYQREYQRQRYYKDRDIEAPATIAAYVYAYEAGPFCKIGVAKDVERRMANWRTGCPYEPVLITKRWCEDAFAEETSLKQHLEHKLVRGEWFRLSESEIAFVREWGGDE